MNEPDDSLRAHFQRQRLRDETHAPSFQALSARARTRAATQAAATGAHRLWWLAPAGVAVAFAILFLRPPAAPPHEFSDRVVALIEELDTPTFADNTLPTDLLPAAFIEPRSTP